MSQGTQWGEVETGRKHQGAAPAVSPRPREIAGGGREQSWWSEGTCVEWLQAFPPAPAHLRSGAARQPPALIRYRCRRRASLGQEPLPEARAPGAAATSPAPASSLPELGAFPVAPQRPLMAVSGRAASENGGLAAWKPMPSVHLIHVRSV